MINHLAPDLLRKYREEKDLTQIDLAVLLDVKQSAVSGYESGSSTPTLKVAFKIQAVTGGKVPAQSWVTHKHTPSENSALLRVG